MHLLFDLDGTLTDPFEGITKSIRYALGKLGRKAPPARELGWCIGPPLHQSFLKLLNTEDADLGGRALALYRERFGKVGLFENEVFDGIPECLIQLSETGFSLRVATAKPTVYANRILEHFALSDYFEAIHGSELDGTRTDKSELIRFILDRDRLSSEETIMIGDREHDILGARKNNVAAIGVAWGYGAPEELRESGASEIAFSPQSLAKLLMSK